jgi:hypothetical protein
MRRLIYSLVAMGLLSTQQAQAQLQCLTQDERGTVELAALRSELMVLATGCHYDDAYNAFIRKYQSTLMHNEQAVGDILKRKYGRRAQQEHDRFTTELANYESDAATALGGDFCAHNGMMFSEVLSLPDASDLQAYAAGKNLVPPNLAACTEVAEAPARRAPVHHTVKRR